MNFTFKKEEHLCSKKAIETLLRTGKIQFCFPYRVLWMITDYPIPQPSQIAISVAKKRFKRANKRNLIKRYIREAYRLNKAPFYDFLEEKGLKVQLLFVYIAPEVLNYDELDNKIKIIFERIMAELQKTA